MPFERMPEQLVEETRLLQELTDLLTQVRHVRPDRPPLVEILDKQAALCDDIAARRQARMAALDAAGYQARDLLVALLNNTPKANHEAVVSTFRAFVAAAETTQAQIDINREFFAVALAAVEDALSAARPDTGPTTYDARGLDRGPGGSMIVSTAT